MSQRLMANNAALNDFPEFLKQLNGKLLVTPDAVDGVQTAALLAALVEVQFAVLVELRTMTTVLNAFVQGLPQNDELDQIRVDQLGSGGNPTTVF